MLVYARFSHSQLYLLSSAFIPNNFHLVLLLKLKRVLNPCEAVHFPPFKKHVIEVMPFIQMSIFT